MFKRLTFLSLVFLVVGCVTTPTYEPLREIQFVDENKEWILVARHENVDVHAHHSYMVYDDEHRIFRDAWAIRVVNNNTVPQCVGLIWRNIDYRIEVPNVWWYLRPNETRPVGRAIQEVWELERVSFVLHDAVWHVNEIMVMEPTKGQCIAKET